MAELNLASLFDSSVLPCYLANASLSPQDDDSLREARRTIRDRLREQLPQVLRDPRASRPVKMPKFFTQGSYGYKTIISPLRPPSQQADLDDGIYLPLSDLLRSKPSIDAAAYIDATDSILQALAKERAWHFKSNNPNCSRLIIDTDKHVDVPRYCMPDEQFSQLVTKALNEGLDSAELAARHLDDDNWQLMPLDNVLLAHRKRGWIKSDPRPLHEWVKTQDKYRGSHFLKVIKIVKGWRDFQQWDRGDPKSILLMAAIGQAKWTAEEKRLDLSLLYIVDQLPSILSGPVINPAGGSDEEPDLSKRLDEDGIRNEVVDRLSYLASELRRAIYECSANQACQVLIQQFGNRLPNDPARIVAAAVTSAPNRIVTAPVVQKTRAA